MDTTINITLYVICMSLILTSWEMTTYQVHVHQSPHRKRKAMTERRCYFSFFFLLVDGFEVFFSLLGPGLSVSLVFFFCENRIFRMYNIGMDFDRICLVQPRVKDYLRDCSRFNTRKSILVLNGRLSVLQYSIIVYSILQLYYKRYNVEQELNVKIAADKLSEIDSNNNMQHTLARTEIDS